MTISFEIHSSNIYDEVQADNDRLRDFFISEIERLYPEVLYMIPLGIEWHETRGGVYKVTAKYKK